METVVVKCPKCGQMLQCEQGGIGTCPKCGTKLRFPQKTEQDIQQTVQEGEAYKQRTLAKFGGRRKDPNHADAATKSFIRQSASVNHKKGGIFKKIVTLLLCLLLVGGIGGGVFYCVYMISSGASVTGEVQLSAGNYVAGQDFPAGRYNLRALSGYGTVSAQGGPISMNETMAPRQPNAIPTFQNAEFSEGTTVTISGTLQLELKPSR